MMFDCVNVSVAEETFPKAIKKVQEFEMDQQQSFNLAKSQVQPALVNIEMERAKTYEYTDDDRLISVTPRNLIQGGLLDTELKAKNKLIRQRTMNKSTKSGVNYIVDDQGRKKKIRELTPELVNKEIE